MISPPAELVIQKNAQGQNEEIWFAMPQPPLSTALCPTTCDSVVSSPPGAIFKLKSSTTPRQWDVCHRETPGCSGRVSKPHIAKGAAHRAQNYIGSESIPLIERSGFGKHTVRGAISACRAPSVELKTLLGLLTLSRPGQQSVLKSLLTEDCTRFPDPQQAWSSV